MPANEPTSLLCGIAETSKLLGGLGHRTVYSLMAGGKLPPSYKLGGKRVWRRSDIECWIELGMPTLEKFIILTRQGSKWWTNRGLPTLQLSGELHDD